MADDTQEDRDEDQAPPGSPEGELTAKQRQFVQEYLVDFNATQAAIRAGYSERTADVQGPRLLGRPHVAAALALARDALLRRTEVTADRTLQHMARMAFSDLRGAFRPDGSLMRPDEWDDATAAHIGSVEVVTRNAGEGTVEYVSKIRAVDKRAATADIARVLGMFRDSLDVRHAGTVFFTPQWVAVQGAILRALEPFPEARAAVLAALEGIA